MGKMAALRKVLGDRPELLGSLGLGLGVIAADPMVFGESAETGRLKPEETDDYIASAGLGGGMLGLYGANLMKRPSMPTSKRAAIASLLGLSGIGAGSMLGYGAGKLFEGE
jgi:hypothetical protein